MLAVMYSQALVLPANEDCADDVTDDEDAQTDVVHSVVVIVVVDGEENEADCANDCSNGAKQRVNLLPNGRIAREFAGMTQVALEDEGEIERDDRDGGHGNEHRFEVLCANV